MSDAAGVITTRLFGGAGNQLFQYAAGRALADHLGCDLAIDARYVSDNSARADCFEHFAHARLRRDIALPPAKHDGALRYALWRMFGRNPRFHREAGLGFDPGMFTLSTGIYLHGYWQSERYFDTIKDSLRQDLAFTTPLNPGNRTMADHIAQAPTPVALHVRRGDYTASGAYAACTPAYYRSSVAQLHDRLNTPLTCFVFSNDPTWAAANLNLGQETVIVDLNDETTGHFDMYLMSLCTHNVIANSTFSWWGAWLNTNPEKIVIAPKQWFADPRLNNPDLLPTNWTQLQPAPPREDARQGG